MEEGLLLDFVSFRSLLLLLFLLVLWLVRAYIIEPGRKPVKSIGWRPIPQPRSLPIVRNLLQISLREPLLSINELAKNYRDCFRVDVPGVSIVIINSQRLYNEACDSRRFHKEPTGALLEARNGGGDGLLTAWTNEENWGIAHRVVAPLYGKAEVKEMFDDMYKVTSGLVDEWTRLGPAYTFNPYSEFSKFTLDMIAHCAFDLQLNSIRMPGPHRFSLAMTYFLSESGKRALRPSFISKYVLRKRNKRYWEAIEELQALSKEAIDKRKSNGKKANDVLNAMLYNEDPTNGKKMTQESCIYNTLSLLGAGYETTASMLSWCLILLLKNPTCLSLLRHELNQKLGERPVTKDDVSELPYLTACVRETLRLYPSAYAHSIKLREEAAKEGAAGLGEEQYLVKRSDTIRLNLLAVQRDPLVFGDDAEEFKPERMLDERFRKLPRNSWKPFGTGARICIGNFFAMQEACVVISTLLQTFDFKLIDDRCRCHIGDTLILQPVDCAIQVTRREKGK